MSLTDTLAPSPAPQTSQARTTAADTVMIVRADTGEQVFAAARPMKANVYEVARLMDHPLEDGSEVTDHIVFMPVEIEQPLMIVGDDMASVFDEIRQLYHAGEILNVQTRARTYESMVIQAMPHDEQADALDAVTVGLQLKEARFIETQYAGAIAPAQTARPARASTVRRGAQQPAAAAPEQEDQGSVLFRAFGRG